MFKTGLVEGSRPPEEHLPDRVRTDVYDLHRPLRQTVPLVFSSPHSGADYPKTFLARSVLSERSVRSSEDAFVDQLFDTAPGFGAPLLAARVPRAYIDLNRAADELDPALIDGLARTPHNPRVSSGLGVIPRVVAGGRAIYSGKLSLIEAEARVARCWQPYHAVLKGLIDETLVEFGEAVLIDCHSMPHEAIEAHARPGAPKPEVVLGDRFGASAAPWVIDRVEAAFTRAGLRVVRNAPFAGAYIAQTYGRPLRRMHAIQVEVDRSLYMDEEQVEPLPEFTAFRAVIASVMSEIAGTFRGNLPLAAE